MSRSLVWTTNLDVLPFDRVIERRDGYLAVRSPSNPQHYWGNLLLFDAPPGDGDGARWERLFEAEFANEPRVRHRTLAWDVDGELGRAREEFLSRGYELEETVGMIGSPDTVRPHPRANAEVVVRALAPGAGDDAGLWEQVVEIQIAADQGPFDEQLHRAFRRNRLADLRTLFRAGRGAWFVALDREEREVLASCGVVVTGDRGRFQTVDTVSAHRRRGICSRLVVDAAHHAAQHYGARQFVIGADPGYHALGLYQSLGFEPAEHVAGVFREPPRD